ncbi:D-hexose-6-phosphate mutarotase [Sanguibacter hominis ATCC BAA-789]|uniref:Putative glucose-6-phosphate 1-epimerase n=1 Tax=Sanguibacter hominis ATCC BAA-789 TaxID=1312740 RepID=A0A9X5FGB2_9MICO|nr:D-hexose-6-phosphate mutarotase [Sanguibacter hominis]NKX93914.1 D-hexose-6-phosphate mutarotase [Sanguibacter hominis ATCC BAA-789]
MPVTLPPSVHVEPGVGDAELLVIETPSGTARLHTYGAHLVSWVPADGADVLWVSPRSAYTPGAAIRGGVPLCFPWFGPHPSGTGPAHGFARTSVWRLVEATDLPDDDAHPGGVAVTLALTEQDVDPALTSVWPHPFEARVRLVVGRELSLSLAVTNTGGTTFAVSEALHTYLAVGDVRRAIVTGLDGATYVDKVADDVRVQVGPVTLDRETDRVYTGTGATTQVVESGRPTVTVAKSGSRSTVVWNPWVAKAAAMADVPDDGWTGFLCVETANALDDTLTVEPGETRTITTRLSVG